jgi:uncharacterized membrane protein
MHTNRLEAFSDGVMAILITILVLELKVPHGADFAAIEPLIPVFGAYVMSFIYLGIYWNNHHHLLIATNHSSGPIMWANLHLFFWLSLMPFVTGWMGENHMAFLPVLLYGIVLLCSALAYTLLTMAITKDEANHDVRVAIGNDKKGKISLVLYLLGIALTFANIWLAIAVYAGVALMWLVPDRRIEAQIHKH